VYAPGNSLMAWFTPQLNLTVLFTYEEEYYTTFCPEDDTIGIIVADGNSGLQFVCFFFFLLP
jgi:hypothetical protein